MKPFAVAIFDITAYHNYGNIFETDNTGCSPAKRAGAFHTPTLISSSLAPLTAACEFKSAKMHEISILRNIVSYGFPVDGDSNAIQFSVGGYFNRPYQVKGR